MGNEDGAKRFARGPYMKFPVHRRHLKRAEDLPDLCADLRRESPERLLAADLFSGAGGLSLGLEDSGITVVLASDIFPEANETHARHFAGLTLDWDLSDPEVVQRLGELLRDVHIDVVAGGPPCQPFSKAGRSKIRDAVQKGLRDPHDQRRDLWQSYLEVISIARPRAVVMENVPDMALDREMFILRSMAQRLEDMDYSVDVRIVQTSDYGVPQHRQRLILIALADRVRFTWPTPVAEGVTLRQAISDLPAIKPGWVSEETMNAGIAYPGARTDFQRYMRRPSSQSSGESPRVFDHVTRAVRPDDLAAFKLMDSHTKYSDLPPELKRYRSDIFDDKYKRLDWDSLSRTITAHIAKDGYWYIHPEEHRTLTVREAARIQTFPDYYRFSGTPAAGFKQIGNAVPPMLGQALGGAVQQSLVAGKRIMHSREQAGDLLARAWAGGGSAQRPWLREGTRFQVIIAETLFARQSALVCRFGWQAIEDLVSPAELIQHENRFIRMASWLDRGRTAKELVEAFRTAARSGQQYLGVDDIDALIAAKVVPQAIADIALLAGTTEERQGDENPVVVNQPVLRVAARYRGDMSDHRNRRTDGRLGVAELIGFGPQNGDAHLELLEIGRNICVGPEPDCAACPLSTDCSFAALEAGAAEAS